MKLEVGDRLPADIEWNTRVRDEEMAQQGIQNPYKWEKVVSGDLFKGKRVILFALPGAFTPTCSAEQLPGYEENYQLFRTKGINEIYCLSVNDSFVMNAWFRYQQINGVKPIPDGSGDFTAAVGALVDKDNLSFGKRSWRYSLLVNDGVVEAAFIEDGFGDNVGDDPFEVSDALTMYNYIMNESPVGQQLELTLEETMGTEDVVGG